MSDWGAIFAQGRVIPHHVQRWKHSAGDSAGFQIFLGTLEGIPNNQGTSEGNADAQYQVRLSLFDFPYHHFFGRTWKSSVKPLKTLSGQTSKVFFNETIYFHTSLNDPNIVIVAEVIAISKKRDGTRQELSCGFGLIRLLINQPDEDTASQSKRISLASKEAANKRHFAGLASRGVNRHMTLIEKSHIQYIVRRHNGLQDIFHLLPPNALVSGSEKIPGILHGRDDTGDALKKPHLQKTITCHLDRLYLMMYPSLEKFEEELLILVNSDCLPKGSPIAGGTPVSIQERRLHIGVHNGWCFVQPSQVVVVTPENRTIKGHTVSSLRKKQTSSQTLSSTALVLRSRIRLPEMVNDPRFAIVFLLEYVFCVPSGVGGKVALASVPNTSYMRMIRWASWNHLLGAGATEVTVSLQGGPPANPSNNLVYKIPPTNMSSDEVQQVEGGTLFFNFSLRSERQLDDNESVVSLSQELVQSKKKVTLGNAKTMAPTSVNLQESQIGPALSISQLTTSSRYPTISHSSKIPLQQVPSQLIPSPMAFQLSHAEIPGASGITHLEAEMGDHNLEYSNADHLQELAFSPVHAPVVAMGTQTGSTTSILSRAALARLHSVGFPEILDCNNEVAEVDDPSSPVNFNPQREEADYLQCNEIVLQFLAFSSIQERNLPMNWPQTVYFTFQFYRFQPVTTPRLQLVQVHSKGASRTETPARVIVSVNKDGSINQGCPGYQLKYMVDPGSLKPGEQRWFLRYLALQTLQIDVWDGDSLLLIGSAAVEMKHLLRQGRTAVQVAHELEVITTEYEQDLMVMSGDISKQGVVKPIGVHTVIKGRLHLRMGNAGHLLDQKLKRSESLPASRSRIITAHDGRSSFRGGSFFSSRTLATRKNVSQAQKLADLDSELAAMLYSRMKEASMAYQQPNSETDAAHRRKMERMMAVRQLESQGDLGNTKSFLLSPHEERTQHTRDLQIIEAYRERTKAECISSMLNEAITSNYTVYATLGTAEFFEFQLKNPYNVQYTVSIEIDHADLRVIVNTQEWRHFKELTNTTTPIEENMFHIDQQSVLPQLYLRPKETVYVPFTYQTFSLDHTTMLQSPGISSSHKDTVSQYKSNTMSSKIIKVSFKTSDEKPIAILRVNVEPQPHVVDQTFRFYHPELTFLKKSIRLPPWYSLPGAPVGTPGGEPELFVRCSDPNIICDTKKLGHGEPQDVFVKVAGGPSPQIKKFFIVIYTDRWLAAPIQIWQIYVHSLKRVDLGCVTGQLTQMSLVLRGTQVVRKVRAYTSHPHELKVDPEDVFVLPPNGIQDLHIAVRPNKAGSRFIYLNLVDVDQHQLVASWLVCVVSRNPVISKAFEIMIPSGDKGCNKRITYTNPYQVKKRYTLQTNRADLLQFKEDSFEVGGGETYTIGLRFAPSDSSGLEEILIFINDHEEKNEETFCVKVIYEQTKKSL
ncbi:PREDICTED: nephrocystin-4 [Nanorana parkeri]|uniref:nephrocystin-4 n=1 Tax=Nanorana parkeri TaxID=125878 RepID=UPI0008542B3E|nr:PREDICTED: nephrocystin-4 [Nanorana parkeri]